MAPLDPTDAPPGYVDPTDLYKQIRDELRREYGARIVELEDEVRRMAGMDLRALEAEAKYLRLRSELAGLIGARL